MRDLKSSLLREADQVVQNFKTRGDVCTERISDTFLNKLSFFYTDAGLLGILIEWTPYKLPNLAVICYEERYFKQLDIWHISL